MYSCSRIVSPLALSKRIVSMLVCQIFKYCLRCSDGYHIRMYDACWEQSWHWRAEKSTCRSCTEGQQYVGSHIRVYFTFGNFVLNVKRGGIIKLNGVCTSVYLQLANWMVYVLLYIYSWQTTLTSSMLKSAARKALTLLKSSPKWQHNCTKNTRYKIETFHSSRSITANYFL